MKTIKANNANNYMRQIKALAYLAGKISEYEAEQLYQKLGRIELRECRRNEKECNGDIESDENRDEKVKEKVQMSCWIKPELSKQIKEKGFKEPISTGK